MRRCYIAIFLFIAAVAAAATLPAQAQSTKVRKPDPALDPGTIANGVYQNKAFALACKIPQGFQLDEDPYAIAIGNKTLARGDFHKDRGTRVMRQSTLVMLSHGYAVSI